MLLTYIDRVEMWNSTGHLEIVSEATPALQQAQLTQFCWALNVPFDDAQISTLIAAMNLLRTEDETAVDLPALAKLADHCHCFINQHLPTGYWLIQTPSGFTITKTALLPIPAEAYTKTDYFVTKIACPVAAKQKTKRFPYPVRK